MWALWVLVYFAMAVAGHAVFCRLPFVWDTVSKFLVVGGLLGLVLSGHMFLLEGLAVETWTALLMYGFGCELYIFLFTLVSSSVSASLLLRLRTGNISHAEIDRLYSNTQMVDVRIENLVATGLLRVGTSGYLVTDKGRALLIMFKALRHFFRPTVGSRPAGGMAARN